MLPLFLSEGNICKSDIERYREKERKVGDRLLEVLCSFSREDSLLTPHAYWSQQKPTKTTQCNANISAV